jgi:hypothetical protein
MVTFQWTEIAGGRILPKTRIIRHEKRKGGETMAGNMMLTGSLHFLERDGEFVYMQYKAPISLIMTTKQHVFLDQKLGTHHIYSQKLADIIGQPVACIHGCSLTYTEVIDTAAKKITAYEVKKIGSYAVLMGDPTQREWWDGLWRPINEWKAGFGWVPATDMTKVKAVGADGMGFTIDPTWIVSPIPRPIYLGMK